MTTLLFQCHDLLQKRQFTIKTSFAHIFYVTASNKQFGVINQAT